MREISLKKLVMRMQVQTLATLKETEDILKVEAMTTPGA